MIYTAEQLSNDDYHSSKFPQSSGSELWAIHNDCPAAFIGAERKVTKALKNGTAFHCAMLETERFHKEYVRGIDASEKDYLVTNTAMKNWLQNAGRKVPSSAAKADLIAMLAQAGCDQPVLDVEIEWLEKRALEAGCEILSAAEYDQALKMQSAMTSAGYMITKQHLIEVSCIDTDADLKCRWDLAVPRGELAPDSKLSKNGEIWDYKTTISSEPRLFADSALKYGYWAKMALQADLYERQFGAKPDRVVLLAQSKTAPFIAQAYQLTEQQLEVGREQYQTAKKLLDECRKTDKWPAYGGGVESLETPGWAAFQFGFEDTIEIIEG